MMGTEVESMWVLAVVAKCGNDIGNTIIIALVMVLSCVVVNVIFWAHPGGPAWGKQKWRKQPTSCGPAIPGPRGIPILGSMELMTGLAHHKLAAAAEARQAKRLMAFSLGQTRAVVTCNPHVAKHILNSSAFADRPANESAYSLMFNRSIGFAPYGVYWTALRKITAAHLFCPKQVMASQKHRLRIANQLVHALLLPAQPNHPTTRLRDLLKLASLNNLMCSLFGRTYDLRGLVNPETEELKDLVDQGYHLLAQLNWSDHLSFLSDFDFQKIRFSCSRIVPRVHRFVGGIIAQHKTTAQARRGEEDQMTPTSTASTDFVDVLLSLKGADRLSDSDIISVLWEMIFRGTDTVAVLIEWILARLVLHPEIQSKVQDELDNVVGRSRGVTECDLTELVYLTAVVKEVLRFHPPGPLLSWSRLSIRDSTLDGYHVPAGTTAMVNMWAIMRDPQLWDDPLTFNPDRFLGNSDLSLLFGSDLRIAPFGSGRRSCPGKTLGMTTVTFWVATLLHEFQFAPAFGQSVDLSEQLRLSCEMANPLQVTVRPRRCFSASTS